MDEVASLADTLDRALLIGCRSLEVRPIPLRPRLAVRIVHSGMVRALVDGEYANRRHQELVAVFVPARRDATPPVTT